MTIVIILLSCLGIFFGLKLIEALILVVALMLIEKDEGPDGFPMEG